jgi:hypothetical protein
VVIPQVHDRNVAIQLLLPRLREHIVIRLAEPVDVRGIDIAVVHVAKMREEQGLAGMGPDRVEHLMVGYLVGQPMAGAARGGEGE